MNLKICSLALILLCPGAWLQGQNQQLQTVGEGSASPAPTTEKPISELSSHEDPVTFKVNVRLVLVRAVVRDAEGRPVPNLRKDDFQIFDNHKPERITQFFTEQAGNRLAREQKTSAESSGGSPAKPAEIAERFIAYLVDDVHVSIEDLRRAQLVLERRVRALGPTDRAAIFTTSGQGNLDFTDDQEKLVEAVRKIQNRSLADHSLQQCPYMSYYMADLIVNRSDQDALGDATRDAFRCSGVGAASPNAASANEAMATAQSIALSMAQQVLSLGDSEVYLALQSIKELVRRMSTAPGQRVIVLISPGFITRQQETELGEISDAALRANIMLSAIDVRGLYVPAAIVSLDRGNMPNLATSPREALYIEAEASANDDVLSVLSDATGGVFFHNNNDLESGLKRAAETPEYYYVLGFAPQNLRYDGRFHSLKVMLNRSQKFTIEARKGYYAPRHPPTNDEQANQEIQEALFSQEEVHELPIDLHTQFFKPSELDAKLSVVVHVDVKRLHFQKVDGRNHNNLTIAAGIFDRNGALISGNEKTLEMRLKDETLERKVESGVTLKTSFEVKPGTYLVRLVVRDSEGLLSAENAAVEVP